MQLRSIPVLRVWQIQKGPRQWARQKKNRENKNKDGLISDRIGNNRPVQINTTNYWYTVSAIESQAYIKYITTSLVAKVSNVKTEFQSENKFGF